MSILEEFKIYIRTQQHVELKIVKMSALVTIEIPHGHQLLIQNVNAQK